MNWNRTLLALLACISMSCFAQDAAKLAISKRTWSPIFAAINLDKGIQGRPVKREDLERINERFYQVNAEYLEEPDLLLQEKMYRTAVGKKIGESMVRTLFGLAAFTLKYEDFSKAEQDEWESFARANHLQVKQLEEKMKGFPDFVRAKLAQKDSTSK